MRVWKEVIFIELFITQLPHYVHATWQWNNSSSVDMNYSHHFHCFLFVQEMLEVVCNFLALEAGSVCRCLLVYFATLVSICNRWTGYNIPKTIILYKLMLIKEKKKKLEFKISYILILYKIILQKKK